MSEVIPPNTELIVPGTEDEIYSLEWSLTCVRLSDRETDFEALKKTWTEESQLDSETYRLQVGSVTNNVKRVRRRLRALLLAYVTLTRDLSIPEFPKVTVTIRPVYAPNELLSDSSRIQIRDWMRTSEGQQHPFVEAHIQFRRTQQTTNLNAPEEEKSVPTEAEAIIITEADLDDMDVLEAETGLVERDPSLFTE